MNEAVYAIYREYLELIGDKSIAASLTLADMMQQTLDATPFPLAIPPVAPAAAPPAPPVDPTQPMTVPQVAKLLRVGPDKVLTWIRSGRLRGYNVAEKETGKPKYRVNPADLEEFTQRRVPGQPVPVGRPAGSRNKPKLVPRPVLDLAEIAKAKAERAKRGLSY